MRSRDEVAELSWTAPDAAPTFGAKHEPLVRQLVSTALRRRGWSIQEAADGTLALMVGPENLDLLLADYAMPAVLSPTAARKARSVRQLQRQFVRQPRELVSSGRSAE